MILSKPNYYNVTEYISLWFVKVYNRFPTKLELEDLVSRRFPLVDSRYIIKINRMLEFAIEKKNFYNFIKNG